MDQKPSDWLFSVVDLFAIVLPGGVLTFAIASWLSRYPSWEWVKMPPSESAGWVAFVFGAYMLGHFVHLAGSKLDYFYEPLYGAHSGRAESTDALGAGVRSALAALNIDLGVPANTPPKQALHAERKAVLRLSEAFLRLRSSRITAQMDRLEAESKFFRSMVVLLAILTVMLGVALIVGNDKVPRWIVAVLVGAMVLAFTRYCERRHKRVDLVYRSLLVQVALDAAEKRGHGTPPAIVRSAASGE